MRQIIPRALQKFSKLTAEQVEGLLLSMAADIDRLETVLDSLAEGILVCDSEHNLILANKYADLLLPISRHGDDTVRVWNVVMDGMVAAYLEDALLSGDQVRDREFETEAKGFRRLLSISIFPLVKDFQVKGSLIRVDDITEKRKKESRIRRIENLASLTTLAAGVAHEIKNPLGSISIHIQLLQRAFKKNEDLYFASHPEDRPDPNFSGERGPTAYFAVFHQYITVINEEIDRLNRIVVDFLFAVKPMDLNLREGNFNTLVKELVDFIGFELDKAHVKTILKLDESLPLFDFDERFMKQAMLNLIQNAVAAMNAGGNLTITTEQKDGDVLIAIQDTGIGIPEANMSKIFEPYFTTKEEGTGLGLTLVFKIIREHQGEIAVSSRKGKGTCFTITLPIPQRDRRLLPPGGYSKDEIAVQVKQATERIAERTAEGTGL
ncbi:MAG: PAS domain-containing sensor histidine kinase [Spirochaetaceae bacterium]|jgi:signal transduction histidine kinase|nr:PAS domain-containing sensor histidine kinase [Spirochaetaceae bacterium]